MTDIPDKAVERAARALHEASGFPPSAWNGAPQGLLKSHVRAVAAALIESGELVPASELAETRKWMAALRDLDGHTIQEAARFFMDAPPECPPEVLALGSAWVDKMLRGQQMLKASWDWLEAERDELRAERDRLERTLKEDIAAIEQRDRLLNAIDRHQVEPKRDESYEDRALYEAADRIRHADR